MQTASAVKSLEERGIGIEGEGYYAVVLAYLNTINSLENKPKLDGKNLLKQAGKTENVIASERAAEQAQLDSLFSSLLEGQDDALSAMLKGDEKPASKIEYLHNYACEKGLQRENIQSYGFSRRLSDVDANLNQVKSSYEEEYQLYRACVGLQHDDNKLEDFARSANINTLSPELKQMLKNNASASEDKFLEAQDNYVGLAVSYLVNNANQFDKAQALENA